MVDVLLAGWLGTHLLLREARGRREGPSPAIIAMASSYSRSKGPGSSAGDFRDMLLAQDENKDHCLPQLLRRAGSYEHLDTFDAFKEGEARLRQLGIAKALTINADATHFGVFEWPTGSSYIGEIKESEAHGLGMRLGADGWIYSGAWIRGSKHDVGVFVWLDGQRYFGSWVGGQPSGAGVLLQDADKRIYAGEWRAGLRSGHGCQVWLKTGRVYKGVWNDGQPEGFGVETYRDGGYYRGLWKGGRRHGFGERYWPPVYNEKGEIVRHPEVYTGSWKNDRKSGFGRMEFANGAVYEGQWVGNRRNGLGRLSRGTLARCGKWSNDELSVPLKATAGKILDVLHQTSKDVDTATRRATISLQQALSAEAAAEDARQRHFEAAENAQRALTLASVCLRIEHLCGPESKLTEEQVQILQARFPPAGRFQPLVLSRWFDFLAQHEREKHDHALGLGTVKILAPVEQAPTPSSTVHSKIIISSVSEPWWQRHEGWFIACVALLASSLIVFA
ncbi:uncharacterized protein MONBRDRAFT_31392 [Monosiga brevicollis MX1]|uniref:Uncharacterized protein n=1 Tax=Monosiga brevicollis TaxID=81824 RepID=A9USW9_MONBE|nr:uncharacterized protein MONBRDRAFT_31392 [Monosiga brevicollis MX1]EDQ91396.1 predicted protein [Monosiga brevicollis MX1]|eukprot:XP_001743818.1 hypothetical protein [Monosiga brevicollis MX1]